MSAIVFMDTETLGLSINSPIWEFAAVKRITSGPRIDETAVEGMSARIEETLHLFIHHDVHPWFDSLPASFREDYKARWDGDRAVEQDDAAEQIAHFIGGAHVVGAVPDFDTTRIRHQLLAPHAINDPWHYHLVDIENMIVGYLMGIGKQLVNQGVLPGLDIDLIAPPWSSDTLSRAVDVDPDQFARHTAMGNVRWAMAQWDAVIGGAA